MKKVELINLEQLIVDDFSKQSLLKIYGSKCLHQNSSDDIQNIISTIQATIFSYFKELYSDRFYEIDMLYFFHAVQHKREDNSIPKEIKSPLIDYYPFFYEMDIVADLIFLLEANQASSKKYKFSLSKKASKSGSDYNGFDRQYAEKTQMKRFLESSFKFPGSFFNYEIIEGQKIQIPHYCHSIMENIYTNFATSPWHKLTLLERNARPKNINTAFSFRTTFGYLEKQKEDLNLDLMHFYLLEHISGFNLAHNIYETINMLPSSFQNKSDIIPLILTFAPLPNVFGRNYILRFFSKDMREKHGLFSKDSLVDTINFAKKYCQIIDYGFLVRCTYTLLVEKIGTDTNLSTELRKWFSRREQELSFKLLAFCKVSPYLTKGPILQSIEPEYDHNTKKTESEKTAFFRQIYQIILYFLQKDTLPHCVKKRPLSKKIALHMRNLSRNPLLASPICVIMILR